jgi:hypothetical protein
VTADQALKLVAAVPKESVRAARAKAGKTNGEAVVHIVDLDPADKSRSSTTIKTVAEWELHSLNKRNRRKAAREESPLSIEHLSGNAPKVLADETEDPSHELP